jgi:hypothetical protein
MANIRRGELVTDQETAARIAKIRAHAEYWSTTAQGSEEADDALWLLAQLQAAQARIEAYQESLNLCENHTPDRWEGDGTCMICEGVRLQAQLQRLRWRVLEIARLVNAYHNDGTTLSAAETLREIANALGTPDDPPESALLAEAPVETKGATMTQLEQKPSMADAAEMLWVVLASVSGGDWTQQSPDGQEAAARWRDNYFAALAEAPVAPRTLRDAFEAGFQWGVNGTDREGEYCGGPVEQGFNEWLAPVAPQEPTP